MRNKTRDAYYDDENDPDVLADGHALRVRMELMDSGKMREVVTVINARDFQPHFGTPTDAENLRRQLACDQMIQSACDAWKMAGRDQKPDEPDEDDDPDDDDDNPARRAYQDYKTRLSNAWRQPPRTIVGFGPGTVAGPNAAVAGVGPSRDSGSTSGRPHLTFDEADVQRNDAYEERNARLVNAWKQR